MNSTGNFRIKGRFFLRTFIGFLTVIVLLFSLVFLFYQNTIRTFYLDRLENQLVRLGHSLQPHFTLLLRSGDMTALRREVEKLGKKIAARITLIAPDGSVTADSEKNPATMENHGDRPEVIRALRGEITNNIRYSPTLREPMFYQAMPLLEQDEITHVLRLSIHLSEIDRFLSSLRGRTAAALSLIFLAALAAAWFFSRRLSRPVQELIDATRQFAGGDFNAKIFVRKIRKKDELGQAAENFNRMVEKQKTIFQDLDESRQELQAVISAMMEGVLLIMLDGRITLCNESFKTFVQRQDVTGHSYWEVLRVPGFEEFVEQAFAASESFYKEIGLAKRSFLVGFTPLKDGDKLLVIFRDITGFKELEQMKRDFVVNLTHELKTPLTAIKGFVETLEAEEDIKNTSYIDIIKRHTDRMNQIVSDLLLLSELEEKNRQNMEFVPLDFAEIIGNILKIYRGKIAAKGLKLQVDIAPDLPLFRGEIFKIEQMIINLVDNAVKYTETGHIAISVQGENNGRAVKIRIENTGLPIPEKSLPRLFERFYVVDKSRSRALGGTGLGLSIVKHVALLHDGEVSVSSTKEAGTVFTVILPTVKN